MSVLSQPTPQISVGPPPTLTYQVSVTNGQAYTLTVFQTLNGTNTVVVSPTSYTGTGSLQTYTFTSPVTSYSYYTSVLIGVTTTNSPSVLYYSPYQGPQGVQGNPGTVGGQGPIGPVGPQGPQGLQGVVSVTNYVTCNSLITSGTSSGTVNAHSTAVLTPAGALSGITTISLPSVAAAAAVSTIYKAASSPDNTITSWGDGSGWRFNFLGNAARTSNVLTLVDNGNVGINCNAPAYTLDVGGQTRISGGNTSTNTPSMILVGGGNTVGHGAMIALGNPSMSVSNDFVQLSSKLFGSSGNIAQGWFSISTRSATNTSDGNAYVERITVSNIGLTTATAVGIAQTTPAYTLDVGGNSRILCNANTSTSSFGTTNETLSLMSPCNGYTGGVASIYFGNATANYPLARIYAQDSSTGGNYRSRLVFQTNADSSSLAERMRIEAGGNVGINCNAPAYTLDVAGTTRSQKLFGTLTNTGAIAPISPFAAQNGNPNTGGSLAQIEFQYYEGGYNHYIATRHNATVANSQNAIDFWLYSTTTKGGSTAPGTANVNMMSVTAAGVGINNSTPSYTLDVNGITRLGSPVNGALSTAFYHNPLGSIAFAFSGQTTACNAGGGVFGVYSTDATDSNVGGSIALGGRSYDFGGGALYQTYAKIWGVSTDSGYHGAFVVSTQQDGGLAERMRIDNFGRMGIGTTSPVFTLDVIGNVRSSNHMVVTSAYAQNAVSRIILGPTSQTSGLDYCSLIQSRCTPDNNFASYLSFWTHGSAVTYGDPTERMTIDYSGNVGIGNTSPGYRFDVYGGAANFSFNGTYGTVFVGSSDGLLIQGYSSGASYIRADCNAANGISTNALFLGTGGCNVVDITRTDVQCHPTNAFYVRNDKGNGNFVVEGYSYLAQTLISAPGAWSGREANPQPGQLQIYSTSGSARMILGAWYTGGSGAVCTIQSSDYYSSADHGILLTLNPLGGNVGINTTSASYALTVNGSIYASGDVIAYSDARAKTNVATISNALSKVNAMRGVTYAMKTEPDVQKIGVIAQEVEQIIPELVSTDSTPEQKKSVAYGNITAVLIEAIKELTKRLETLERR